MGSGGGGGGNPPPPSPLPEMTESSRTESIAGVGNGRRGGNLRSDHRATAGRADSPQRSVSRQGQLTLSKTVKKTTKHLFISWQNLVYLTTALDSNMFNSMNLDISDLFAYDWSDQAQSMKSVLEFAIIKLSTDYFFVLKDAILHSGGVRRGGYMTAAPRHSENWSNKC